MYSAIVEIHLCHLESPRGKKTTGYTLNLFQSEMGYSKEDPNGGGRRGDGWRQILFWKKKLEILGFSLLSTHGNSTFFLLITYPRYSSYFLFTLIPEISICSFFNAPLGRSEALHGGECINSHKYLLCWTYYKSVGFCWTYLSH